MIINFLVLILLVKASYFTKCELFKTSTSPPILSSRVWSLSTHGSKPTMNIVTYVSPVAINPYTWAISLYKGSQSLENFQASNVGVLQSLTKAHTPYFKILGKESAKSVEKLKLLKDNGLSICKINSVQGNHDSKFGDLDIITDIPFALCLTTRINVSPVDLGDHLLFFCDISSMLENPAIRSDGFDDDTVLNTAFLRNNGLL